MAKKPKKTEKPGEAESKPEEGKATPPAPEPEAGESAATPEEKAPTAPLDDTALRQRAAAKAGIDIEEVKNMTKNDDGSVVLETMPPASKKIKVVLD